MRLGGLAVDDRERAAGTDELRALGSVVVQAKAHIRRDRSVEAFRGGDVGAADPQVIDSAVRPQRAVVNGLRTVRVRIERNAP